MKIWLINHYAVPPQYYPLARQTNFAKYLQRMGHEAVVFAASTVHNSNQNLITDGSTWREDYVEGVHYVYVKCRPYKGNGLSRILNMYEFAMKLPGVCDRFERPDAIIATSMPPMSCAAGLKIAKNYGCKAIAEIADLWPESLVAYGIAGPGNPAVRYLRRLEKWIYINADRIIFTMDGAYDYIEEQGWQNDIPKEKIAYINNGVDLELFDYNKENNTIKDADLDDSKTFKIVYTGSIRRVNNLSRLVDAAKLVKIPQVKFLVWGGGDQLESMIDRVKSENISNVIFKGSVEKKYVPYITSKADLNILHGDSSSILRYGLSANKLFDYFAAGRPILTDFKCNYNPADKHGCNINLDDYTPAGIAKGVTRVLSMNAESLSVMGQNARLAAEAYDFKALTEDLVRQIDCIETTKTSHNGRVIR